MVEADVEQLKRDVAQVGKDVAASLAVLTRLEHRFNGGNKGPSLEVVLAEMRSDINVLKDDRIKRGRFGLGMLIAVGGLLVNFVYELIRGHGPQ